MSVQSQPKLDLFLVPGVSWHRSVIAGEVVYVYCNDLNGEYFATDYGTHRVLSYMQSGASFADALAETGAEQSTLLKTAPALIEAGLVWQRANEHDGQEPPEGLVPEKPPRPKKPLEARILFALYEFTEIGWIYRYTKGFAGILFGRMGFSAFVILAALAVNGLLANTGSLAAGLANVEFTSAWTAVTLAAVFLVLKGFHELGHALATAHFLTHEGKRLPLIRAGIALFFFLPMPFTNTTASWQLQNKWRRAAIGAAGMYIETWIAIVAALVWASIGESDIKQALLQVMLVSGISTLFFNLNPLVRLDGYYILTDLLDQPNLATRAGRAARSLGHRLLGLQPAKQPSGGALLTYWTLSLCYRCLTMTLIVLAALMIDPFLAALAALLAVTIIIGRPLYAVLSSAIQNDPAKTATVRLRFAGFALAITALAFFPMPDPLILEGHVDFEKRQYVYPEVAGRVRVASSLATANPDSSQAVIENPELHYDQQIARTQLRLAELDYRSSLLAGPQKINTHAERLSAAKSELSEIERRIATLRVTAIKGTWHPQANRIFDGAWVDPRDRKPLGLQLPSNRPSLTAVLDQSMAELTNTNLKGVGGLVQFPGLSAKRIKVRVEKITAVARESENESNTSGQSERAARENGFQIILSPVEGELPDAVKHQGKRFVARLERARKALWNIYWIELEKLIQKRFLLS